VSLALAADCALTLVLALVRTRDAGGLPLQLFALPLLVAGAASLVQLVPLPHALRALLSPESERVAELALRGVPHASWRPLTADVAAGLEATTRLLGATAFLLALGGARDEDERRRLRGALLGALAALALVAAAGQVSPGAVATPRALARFPFANANHAGALLL